MSQLQEIDDISIADLHRDPYPIYARLRDKAPVAFVKSTGRVFLTRAADVKRAKDDVASFTTHDTTTPAERAFQATSMMRLDGPVHLAERRSFSPGLSARNMKAIWKEAAIACADHYLDKLEIGKEVDLFTALAAPYSGAVLAQVRGLKCATATDMVRWSQIIIDSAGNVAGDEAVFARSDTANVEMNAIIDANIERVTRSSDNSVLAGMVAANSPIDRMRCNVKVAIGGGINEPRDAFLTALFGLLTHEGQLDAVQNDPGLCSRAFEESVRWVAPIQISPRKVIKPVSFDGVDLPVGTAISTIQASANRDENAYENPDDFNIHRAETSHFAFGNGPHFCLGTHLSRMSIAQVLLPKLLKKFPKLELPRPADVPWYGFIFRGPLRLDVRLD